MLFTIRRWYILTRGGQLVSYYMYYLPQVIPGFVAVHPSGQTFKPN